MCLWPDLYFCFSADDKFFFALFFYIFQPLQSNTSSTRELGEVRGKRGGEEGVIDRAKQLARLLVVGEIAAGQKARY